MLAAIREFMVPEDLWFPSQSGIYVLWTRSGQGPGLGVRTLGGSTAAPVVWP